MASSGSFSGSICSGHYVLRIDWSQAQNVSANTSTITAKIYLVNDWRLDIGARTANTISIGGTSQGFTSPAVTTTGEHLLNTVTQTVTHESDGSKSIAISAVFSFAATISGTYYSTISASANITLDSIPRASDVSMPTGTMGSSVAITITPASSSFTHTLTYTFGSLSGTISTKTTATTVNWTPALTMANQLPNATSGTGTLKCTTYSGNTAVGSKSITITLKVPTTVVPSLTSLTAARVNGTVPSSWGHLRADKVQSDTHYQRGGRLLWLHDYRIQHYGRRLLQHQFLLHHGLFEHLRYDNLHGDGDGFQRPDVCCKNGEHLRGGLQRSFLRQLSVPAL